MLADGRAGLVPIPQPVAVVSADNIASVDVVSVADHPDPVVFTRRVRSIRPRRETRGRQCTCL